MSRFDGISIRDAEYVEDECGPMVLHVRDPHALTQAAGYLKHIHAHQHHESIYFRGQTKLYEGLVPSLFRGCKNVGTRGKRIAKLKVKIAEIVQANKIFNKFSSCFHEPLLQHYGLRTTWIDLVDNVWVALWFACHKSKVVGPGGQYVHFEQRQLKSYKNYVYVVLVGAESQSISPRLPGLVNGVRTELVDLRMGVPSIFLRPHAQHGVLFRMKGIQDSRPNDYKEQVRGVIRAELEDALGWIGNGGLLNVHSLFPPPTYDEGYKYLLKSNTPSDEFIGGIAHIGA